MIRICVVSWSCERNSVSCARSGHARRVCKIGPTLMDSFDRSTEALNVLHGAVPAISSSRKTTENPFDCRSFHCVRSHCASASRACELGSCAWHADKSPTAQNIKINDRMIIPFWAIMRSFNYGCKRMLVLIQQSAGNHLCLDFCRAFKNVQNAGVTQNAANRVFKRKAVAPMNL